MKVLSFFLIAATALICFAYGLPELEGTHEVVFRLYNADKPGILWMESHRDVDLTKSTPKMGAKVPLPKLDGDGVYELEILIDGEVWGERTPYMPERSALRRELPGEGGETAETEAVGLTIQGPTETNNTLLRNSLGIGFSSGDPTGRLDVQGDEARIWDGSATVSYSTGAGDLFVEDQLEVDGTVYAANWRSSAGGNMLAGGSGISVAEDANGQWTITNTSPSAGGTVTNIATSSPVTGGPISTTGTIGLQREGDVLAGSGISVSGGTDVIPGSDATDITITNSAPDQTVAIASGTGIGVSGSYPNFTVTNTAPDQTVALSSGTGISVSGSYPSFTVTNTSPSSGGTVTSIATTSPITGGTITGSGTLSLLQAGDIIGGSGVTVTGGTDVIPGSDAADVTISFSGSTGDSDWIISGTNMYSGVSGNVGIGTSTPQAKLDVNGQTGNIGQGNSLTFPTGYGANITIGASNSITGGRGTTLLGHDNSASADFCTILGVRNSISSGVSGGHAFGLDNTVSAWDAFAIGSHVVNNVTNSLQFAWNSSDGPGVLTIRDSGNIGIRTTAPAADLDVNGTIRADHYRDNAGGNLLNPGTGIGVAEQADGSWTVTNTSPDQTVSIGSGSGISVSGSYPSFTITNSSPGVADNLGNHSATMDLDMNSYSIYDIGYLSTGSSAATYPRIWMGPSWMEIETNTSYPFLHISYGGSGSDTYIRTESSYTYLLQGSYTASNYFIRGDASGNVSVRNDLTVGTGITLGGVYRTSWPTSASYSAGNDLDLSGTTFNIEPTLDYVTTINLNSPGYTDAALNVKNATGGEAIRIQGSVSSMYGGKLAFGDGDYCYIDEPTDDNLRIHSYDLALDVRGTSGSAGQVLTSDGSYVYWATPSTGSSYWTDAGSYLYANGNSNARVYDTGNTYVYYASSSTGYGFYGTTSSGSTDHCGVYGNNSSAASNTYGVYGTSGYAGVLGSGNSYAIWGKSGAYTPIYGIWAYGSSYGVECSGNFAFWSSTNRLYIGSDYGTTGEVLMSNGASGIYWGTVSGGGDNLGSHTATTNLNMNGYSVYNVAGSSGTVNLGTYSGTYGLYADPYYAHGTYARTGYGSPYRGDQPIDGWGDSYATYGTGRMYYSSTKSSAILDRNGDPRLLYCIESPDVWFQDIGSAQLVDGRTHVDLDPVFVDGCVIDDEHPLKVFIQLKGNISGGVYVESGTDGFTVIQLNEGRENVFFDYIVYAKRKGYEDERFAFGGDGMRYDPYLLDPYYAQPIPRLGEKPDNAFMFEKALGQDREHLLEQIDDLRRRGDDVRASRLESALARVEGTHPSVSSSIIEGQKALEEELDRFHSEISEQAQFFDLYGNAVPEEWVDTLRAAGYPLYTAEQAQARRLEAYLNDAESMQKGRQNAKPLDYTVEETENGLMKYTDTKTGEIIYRDEQGNTVSSDGSPLQSD